MSVSTFRLAFDLAGHNFSEQAFQLLNLHRRQSSAHRLEEHIRAAAFNGEQEFRSPHHRRQIGAAKLTALAAPLLLRQSPNVTG